MTNESTIRVSVVALGLAASIGCSNGGTDDTVDSAVCIGCSDGTSGDTIVCTGCTDGDSKDGTADNPACIATPAAGTCALAGEDLWQVDMKSLDLEFNGAGSGARFGSNGTLCNGESEADTAVRIVCWGVGEANGVERSHRATFVDASDLPQLVVDSRGRARLVWPSGNYDYQRLEYAIDDGPPEVIYEGEALGALYGISIDENDRSVVAFSTGGTHGPNRLEHARFTLHVATRGPNGTWNVEDFAVAERTGAGMVVTSRDARWFVWTPSYGGYGVGQEYPTHVVDLDANAERALPEGEPTLRTLRGSWVDRSGHLNLLASVRHGPDLAADLVHFTASGQSWSRLDVQQSRDLPDDSDVLYGPTIVGDSLRLGVDAEGLVHAWYLENDPSSGPVSLVYAKWDGTAWVKSSRDFYGLRLGDANIRALNAIYDVSAGRDGILRVLMPATTIADPTRSVLLVVTGEHCNASCASL